MYHESSSLKTAKEANTTDLYSLKLLKPNTNTDEVSSSESLRQITQQINGLMSQTHALLNGSVETSTTPNSNNSELERRNQELAVLLDSHRQANEQLQFQLQELVRDLVLFLYLILISRYNIESCSIKH
ncbi:golgin subfamily A member 2-like [Centruroides sculpturatus]|uniref:golgin subfamily A member 2-like n=1 Tax=Centruroides sculpturatus TaxID=218467 RepID=UPI000C6E79E2|nr:golgin subfamily A member 2-like [Centruroides sculpturatus]